MSESREAREGHPAGDPSAVREVARFREGGHLRRHGPRRMGSGCGGDAAGSPGVLRRILKVSGRFEALVADCPLHYTVPRAVEAGRPGNGASVGSRGAVALCAHHGAARRQGQSVAVGHEQGGERGFCSARPGADRGGGRHIVAARPSRRHGAAAAERARGFSTATRRFKPLYGHQQGAVVSYNAEEADGRPSHAYHAFLMAGTRLVLDVDVAPGNRHRDRRARRKLWALPASGGSTGRALSGATRIGAARATWRRARGRSTIAAAPDEGSAQACRAPDGA